MRIAKKNKKAAQKIREIDSNLTTFAIERFHSITTIRLNGRETYENYLYSKLINDSTLSSNESVYLKSTLFSFINLSTSVSLMAVLYVGGNMIREGVLTSGELTKFALQSAFVGLGFSGLSTFYDDMVKGLDATDRIFNALESHNLNEYINNTTNNTNNNMKIPDINLVSDTNNNNTNNNDILTIDIINQINDGTIEFQHVSFTYAGRNLMIFRY